MEIDLKKLQEKFFNDPDWGMMEALIESYIDPLRDMTTVDTTQPGEHVKAEIIARNLAHDSLYKFLGDCKVVKGRILKEKGKNPFE